MKKKKTTKNRKPLIMVIMLVIVLVVIFVIFNLNNIKENENTEQGNVTQTEEENLKYSAKLEDGTKINTSDNLKKVKKYKNLEFSNIQFTSKNGSSVILADVKNVGDTKHESEIIKITILGDNNEVITEIAPVIDNVEAGETIKFNAIITADVVEAKDIKIEEK